ncbi:hypothetical protein D3C80_2175720 [compost metagenome]
MLAHFLLIRLGQDTLLVLKKHFGKVPQAFTLGLGASDMLALGVRQDPARRIFFDCVAFIAHVLFLLDPKG